MHCGRSRAQPDKLPGTQDSKAKVARLWRERRPQDSQHSCQSHMEAWDPVLTAQPCPSQRCSAVQPVPVSSLKEAL